MGRTLFLPTSLKMVAAVGVAFLVWGLVLASPAYAASYTVNSTADTTDSDGCTTASGGCTLREAINAANSSSGVADTIDLTWALLRRPSRWVPAANCRSRMIWRSAGLALRRLRSRQRRLARVSRQSWRPGATSGPAASSLSVAISNLTITNGKPKAGTVGRRAQQAAAAGPRGWAVRSS